MKVGTSDHCPQCLPSGRSGNIELPKGVTKALLRCKHCANVWGPVEVASLDDWYRWGHDAFNPEKRN